MLQLSIYKGNFGKMVPMLELYDHRPPEDFFQVLGGNEVYRASLGYSEVFRSFQNFHRVLKKHMISWMLP